MAPTKVSPPTVENTRTSNVSGKTAGTVYCAAGGVKTAIVWVCVADPLAGTLECCSVLLKTGHINFHART